MKKFKKIASLVVASAMLTSSLAFTTAVSAAEIPADSVSAIDVSTQNEVGDGVILHAFNWSYNSIKENLPAIKAAGYSTVQTSPVQQPKDYGASKDVSGQWWKPYQPVSMSIAENTWYGTKEELKELCTEADKYGIKIICDIVSNHFGNEVESDPNSVSKQVEKYQPDFYNNQSTYFHSYTKGADDSSVQGVVQGHVSACPDLNTGNKNVQNAVIGLLKDCIDCGVDGFRFDAAKHIETPSDGSFGSDYWPTITNAAKSYYTQKTGGNLFIYGEILNTCGAGRKYTDYTDYINVTDNRTGDSVLYGVEKGSASTVANPSYKSGLNASKVVLWAESHDTYEGTAGSAGIANTSGISDQNIIKAWAVVASRKDASALFFARPGSALMGEAATDTSYKSTAVSEINKFHNKFVGQSEKLGTSGQFAYVARGNSGVVLVNVNGSATSASVAGTGLADGSYIDTITGNKFIVSGGTLTGSIGSTGVAVVYNGTTTPRNTVSVESGSFSDDTMVVSLGLDNATSGTYSLDGSAPVTYSSPVAIRIGSDYNYGETINLTVTATDGKETTSALYKYSKVKSASSGVYVFLNPTRKTSWKAPFYAYIYDEDTDVGKTYKNASWPGEAMKYDEGSGNYYLEVSDSTCIVNDEPGGQFDLAHSSNTHVIFSDSAAHQYPGDGSRTKLLLGGSSKIYANSGSNTFENTSLVPSKKQQDATDVTKGQPETTVKPTEPTTAKPTEPTQPTQPTSAGRVYGDVNNDGKITIDDSTLTQKAIVDLVKLSAEDALAADVSGDGKVSIDDATLIQRYISSLGNSGRTGQPMYVDPTTAPTTVAPTTVTPTTVAPTTVEPTTVAPTTAPVDEYTLYFKTTLGWMTADGVNLYAYDTNTGESYQFVKDVEAYPNVYTIDAPESMDSLVVYRALEAVEEFPVASETGPVYNAWSVIGVSPTDNCITFATDESITVGPYIPEEKPAFELDTVYFDNSVAKWSAVYIYGWSGSGLENEAVKMTQIPGTDIWSYEFDEPLSPGATCFLFKDTLSTWVNQTNNITVEEDMNCYKANAGSKTGGTWYYYGDKPEPGPGPKPGEYTLYFKTTLGWMTADGVSLFAYDTASGTSYQLERDVDAYPYVYVADVPSDVNSVIVYRALEEVEETPVPSETGPVYNAWSAKGISATNNCITLAGEDVTVGPYVPEKKPAFELDVVYFDNSVAKWSEVYIYGWAGSGLENEAVKMTQVPGTDIWYYEFDEPLSPGAKCFLFKDTLSTWKNQTNDMIVEDGKNCYKANAGSKTGGTWYLYQ